MTKDRKAYFKAYREANKEKIKQAHHDYFAANKEKIYAYRNEHREHLNEVMRLWHEKYPEKRKEYFRKYMDKNKLNKYMGNRIRFSLHGNKPSAWLTLVPYTLEELKSHLESYFTPEMTWDNYGSYWHVEHVIPICSFNIVSVEDDEFKKCWALDNLRPLPAKENLKKAAQDKKLSYYRKNI